MNTILAKDIPLIWFFDDGGWEYCQFSPKISHRRFIKLRSGDTEGQSIWFTSFSYAKNIQWSLVPYGVFSFYLSTHFQVFPLICHLSLCCFLISWDSLLMVERIIVNELQDPNLMYKQDSEILQVERHNIPFTWYVSGPCTGIKAVIDSTAWGSALKMKARGKKSAKMMFYTISIVFVWPRWFWRNLVNGLLKGCLTQIQITLAHVRIELHYKSKIIL